MRVGRCRWRSVGRLSVAVGGCRLFVFVGCWFPSVVSDCRSSVVCGCWLSVAIGGRRSVVVRGCRRSVIVGRRCRLPRLPLAVVMVVVVSVVVSGWCCGWGCGWDCRWDCRRRRRTHRRLSEAVGGCRRRLAVGWPSMGCGWPSVFVGSRRFPSLSVSVVVGSSRCRFPSSRRRLPSTSVAAVVDCRRCRWSLFVVGVCRFLSVGVCRRSRGCRPCRGCRRCRGHRRCRDCRRCRRLPRLPSAAVGCHRRFCVNKDVKNGWAHGVVVSHPLSMREALSSILSVSISSRGKSM